MPNIIINIPHIMLLAPHIIKKLPHIMMINHLRQSWDSIGKTEADFVPAETFGGRILYSFFQTT